MLRNSITKVICRQYSKIDGNLDMFPNINFYYYKLTNPFKLFKETRKEVKRVILTLSRKEKRLWAILISTTK